MVVNFCEEKEREKSQKLSRSNFHLVSNSAQWGNTFKSLREEIILLSTRRLPLWATKFYTFLENSEFIYLFQRVFLQKTNIIESVHPLYPSLSV